VRDESVEAGLSVEADSSSGYFSVVGGGEVVV
jgi:hypothetical protein